MQQQKIISWRQFSQHTTPKDCWVLIDGNVYNVSDYLVQHPGGDDILIKFSGTDASQKFNQVDHSQYAKSLRNARYVGKIEGSDPPPQYAQKLTAQKQQFQKKKKQASKKQRIYRDSISRKQIALHCSQQDCWTIINGKVYELTEYLKQHPGGVSKIMQWAGKDGSKAFEEQGHSLDAMKKRDEFLIGSVASQNTPLFIVTALVFLGLIFGLYFNFF